MRDKDTIFDDFLRFQVELSFDLEQSFFRSSKAWNDAETILDFGAGNGYYARRLAEKYPEKRFVCVEINEALAQRARCLVRPFDIEIVIGTFVDLPNDSEFDFVIARHVMSYLSDRETFMRWVSSHTTSSAGVLTIDADDTKYLVCPKLPSFEAGDKRFKKQVKAAGGNRKLLFCIQDEWEKHEFRHVRTDPVIVHSDIQRCKELMYMYMLAEAEIDYGSPLPNRLSEELQSWAFNPRSYLQYGIFGSLSEKGGAKRA